MNQEQIKQQAREMAERCVNTAHSNPNNPRRQQWIDRILRELNLESLLEDKARLAEVIGNDNAWTLLCVLRNLSEAAAHLLVEHQCDTHGHEIWSEALRQADRYRAIITNAMQEKESGE